MNIRTLALVLCGCLAVAASRASAQGTDLRIIAPSAPGTGWDQVAQTLRAAIAETHGLAVGVRNLPGGNGLVGLGQFLADPSDTELLVTGLTMLEATLLSRSSPDFGQLTPIARLSAEYYALAVPANSPLKSPGDLATLLGSRPDKLTFGGGPAGGVDHVAVMLLGRALGLPAPLPNYVPFLSGSDARVAAAEEKVGAVILALGEVEPDVTAGRLRILGVTSAERLQGLEVPTLLEAGIPLEFANWRGVAARAGLSPDQQAHLAALVYTATLSTGWQEMLAARRWTSAFLGPAPFQAFVRQEHHRIKERLNSVGLLKRNRE
ncbi:MAG: conserved hypothetical exported protein [Enterovirga sp.]|jgi:putative tricarboxylic transport membrane protein|nr:conserved hypothetical exported protein [Enterovirga sp.]